MAANNINNINNAKNNTTSQSVTDSNKGKRWTKSEEAQLYKEFDSGMSLERMASIHKRTVLGIKYRIAKFLATRLLSANRMLGIQHAVPVMTNRYELPEDALKHWLVSMSSSEILVKLGILPNEYSDSDSDSSESLDSESSDDEKVPEVKPKVVNSVKQCSFVYTHGPWKGEQCEGVAVSGTNACCRHSRALARQESEKISEAKPKVVNPVKQCLFIFERGTRTGEQCDKITVSGTNACRFHPRYVARQEREKSRETQPEESMDSSLMVRVLPNGERVVAAPSKAKTVKKDEVVSSATVIKEMIKTGEDKGKQPENPKSTHPAEFRCDGRVPFGHGSFRCANRVSRFGSLCDGEHITAVKPVLRKLPPRDDNLASRLSSIEEKMEKFSEMVDRLASKF